MNVTIPQNSDLLKHLSDLIQAYRPLFKQQRVFERVKALIFGEILAMGRHTLTQLLVVILRLLGMGFHLNRIVRV